MCVSVCSATRHTQRNNNKPPPHPTSNIIKTLPVIISTDSQTCPAYPLSLFLSLLRSIVWFGVQRRDVSKFRELVSGGDNKLVSRLKLDWLCFLANRNKGQQISCQVKSRWRIENSIAGDWEIDIQFHRARPLVRKSLSLSRLVKAIREIAWWRERECTRFLPAHSFSRSIAGAETRENKLTDRYVERERAEI